MRIYDNVVEYRITAVLESPFHTGEADKLLVNSSNELIIQGNSLAGAFRAYAQKEYPEYVDAIFGSQNNEGSIIVSDGIFNSDSVITNRPRLRIDNETHTGAKHAKFETLVLESGSEFGFTITWFGTDKQKDENEIIVDIFRALRNGSIKLGANKTSGLGKVKTSVTRCMYDLKNADDRKKWLNDEFVGENVSLDSYQTSHEVIFRVKGKVQNVLVKSCEISTVAKSGGNDTNVKTGVSRNIRDNGVPVIPGTSIKGAVRNRVEMIEEYMKLQGISSWIFGNKADRQVDMFSGHVIFEDCKLCNNAIEKPITRIKINKFTGGVFTGGILNESPVYSDLEMVVRSTKNDKANALLLFALRDIGLKLYGFGSGGSIGRGYIDVNEITISHEDREARLVFENDELVNIEDSTGLLSEWSNALEV